MKIYTSYFGNLQNIPKSIVPIAICRGIPKFYTGAVYQDLVPTYSCLNTYKQDNDEEKYNKIYKKEILDKINLKQLLEDFSNISNGKDIALLCYEKSSDFCHRQLVAKWLIEKGVPVMEFSKENYDKSNLYVKTNDEWFTYYYNVETGEKKIALDPEDIEVNSTDALTSVKETFYCIVAGTRTYENYEELQAILDKMLHTVSQKYNIEIVSGGARGADTLAERYAKDNNYKLHIIKADWDTYKTSAGFIRNQEMHKYIKDNTKNVPNRRACVCFWDGSSRGTQHNFSLSEHFQTQLRVFDYKQKKMLRKEELPITSIKKKENKWVNIAESLNLELNNSDNLKCDDHNISQIKETLNIITNYNKEYMHFTGPYLGAEDCKVIEDALKFKLQFMEQKKEFNKENIENEDNLER